MPIKLHPYQINAMRAVVNALGPTEVLQPPKLRTDTEIIDWLERQHTLHRRVVALYVVDGYNIEIEHDGEPIKGAEWHGETLREAYSTAMAHWDLTHGKRDLLAERTIDEIEPADPSIADQQANGYLHTMQAHGRVLRGNPPRSISDDDLCATCANCIDHPRGDLSICSKGWPTIINPDGYITECAQHQPQP